MPNNNNNKAKLRVSESYLVDICIPGWAQDPGLRIRNSENEQSLIVELADLCQIEYQTGVSYYWDVVVSYSFPDMKEKARILPELITFWERVIKELEPPAITNSPARQEWNKRKQRWLQKLGGHWIFVCPDADDEG